MLHAWHPHPMLQHLQLSTQPGKLTTLPCHCPPPPTHTGTQWHPEKPPYEFSMDETPHTLDAIQVSQHLANVFVDHARYSSHKPESHEEDLAMQIYSTPVVFSARFEVRLQPERPPGCCLGPCAWHHRQWCLGASACVAWQLLVLQLASHCALLTLYTRIMCARQACIQEPGAGSSRLPLGAAEQLICTAIHRCAHLVI